MIKDNQKHFNRMHVVIDAVVTICAYLAAWLLRFRTNLFGVPIRTLALEYYMFAMDDFKMPLSTYK